MSMALASQIPQIKRVAVIDDKPEARDTMAESITDAQLQPIVFGKGQIGSLADLISRLLKESDAAIFDYHLSPGNYANFSGAEAVSELYAKKFPAILVTAWSDADIDSIRPYRRHIPVLFRSQWLMNQQLPMEFITACRNLPTPIRVSGNRGDRC